MEEIDKTVEQSIERINAHERMQREYFAKRSYIPREYWKYRWSDYQFDKGIGTLSTEQQERVVASRKAAFAAAVNYAKQVRESASSGRSLIIFGQSDSGKTVLATLILRDAINKLLTNVLYVSFSKLVVDATVTMYKEQTDELVEKYAEPSFLCIDEVETLRNTTDRFKNIFDHLIMTRRNEMKPTIITSKIGTHEMGNVIGDVAHRIIRNQEVYQHVTINSGRFETEDDVFADCFQYDAKKLVLLLKSEIATKCPGGILSSKTLREFITSSIQPAVKGRRPLDI